ncbi:DUF6114 domain-containing protein [Agromyces sp. MMS24-JH15]|uniref:DUF6114 domain-containing protein n=1 Tax=Agromyces sp. MMS24-JH15 TaxID=3243765 RepID=UPI003749E846
MDAHPDTLGPTFDASAAESAARPAGRRARRAGTPPPAPVAFDAGAFDAIATDAIATHVIATDADASAARTEAGPVAAWFRSRPTIGGLITVLGGVAMFFSSQLQLGGMTVHVGIEGAQAMILPAVLIVCGVLAIGSPAQHLFYGIVAMIISVYSLVGVNLGGFFVGFLLGSIGGVVVASWRPKARPAGGDEAAAADAVPATGELATGALGAAEERA